MPSVPAHDNTHPTPEPPSETYAPPAVEDVDLKAGLVATVPGVRPSGPPPP